MRTGGCTSRNLTFTDIAILNNPPVTHRVPAPL